MGFNHCEIELDDLSYGPKHFVPLNKYSERIRQSKELDLRQQEAILDAIKKLHIALQNDCIKHPELLNNTTKYVKNANASQSSIIRLYAEYAVACMERTQNQSLNILAQRIINHPDYHLISGRSRYAFAQVAVAGFVLGLMTVGAMIALSMMVPEVATFMGAVAKVFAEGMNGYGAGFSGNSTLNTANLIVSTVVGGTAVGAVVGFSRQKPATPKDIHSAELNAAIAASKPLSINI